ncbi:hypothetical protein [Clostridium vincentii]|uniref:DUF4834 domain-containing protein n=1 Tax=Clostridium vincentii TaxID=52704 RepID=A0A2T0BHW1_9CLOT|nr:hypothetical protein [Clostridium vincentii]PRR83427.1 hypothetical protein CLVI_09750 [Clostridium vincentii]
MNKILYIIIIVLIMGVFLRIFPYLLIFGIVTWAIVKIYGFFNRKPNTNNKQGSTYKYDAQEKQENVSEDDSDDINEAIDVDYKDV